MFELRWSECHLNGVQNTLKAGQLWKHCHFYSRLPWSVSDLVLVWFLKISLTFESFLESCKTWVLHTYLDFGQLRLTVLIRMWTHWNAAKMNKKYRPKCFLQYRISLALREVRGYRAEIFILSGWMFNLFLMPKLHLRLLSLTQEIFSLCSHHGDLQDEQTILPCSICPWHWYMPLSWTKHKSPEMLANLLFFVALYITSFLFLQWSLSFLSCEWKTVVPKLALSAVLPWKGPASKCTFSVNWRVPCMCSISFLLNFLANMTEYCC